MRTLFAPDFGIWPMAMRLERASDALFHSADHRARLANYLILYDQIVIPTGNLQILPVLRLLLGEDNFDELIVSGEIVLARFDQWISYIGTGGLVFYQVLPDPARPKAPNLGYAFHSPLDEAIDTALRLTNPAVPPERRAALTNLLNQHTVVLPTAELVKGLKDESYLDIMTSPFLRDALAIRNTGRSLDNLLGSDPKTVTLYNPNIPQSDVAPEIRSVLRVGFENYLLRMAGHLKTTEMTGDGATLSVLRGKGQRVGYSIEGDKAFTRMQRISGVPDIGRAFANGELSPDKLLELRRSPEAIALRNWFAEGSPSESAEETLRRYHEAITTIAWVDRAPLRLVRFAATTGWGILEPISGTVASAVDNFLLKKWFSGRSPRLFMVKAKELVTSKGPLPTPKRRRKAKKG